MKKTIATIFLLSWVVVASYALTLMHSWHYSDLSPKGSISLSELTFQNSEQNLGVIHFITPMCGCSREVYKHLMKEGPLDNKAYNEKIIIIDDFKDGIANELTKRGFDVFKLSNEEAKKIFDGEVRGVPLLTIYDQTLTTQYVGGYSEKSITPFTKINYRKFLQKIETKKKVKPLPVIGCAVSKEYQKLLDPFGLKYGEVL